MPTTTSLSDGGYLETWYDPPGSGAFAGTLHAQKHAADGSLVGTEYTHASQDSWSILALSNGGYVVGTAESAPGGTILRGEVFDAAATHLSEFVAGKNWQMAASPDGGFLVTSTFNTNHNFTTPDGLITLYDNAGRALTVTGHVYSASQTPSITVDADGTLHAHWTDNGRSHDLALDVASPPDLRAPGIPQPVVIDDVEPRTGEVGGATNDNTPTFRVPVHELGYVALGTNNSDPGAPRFEITADDVARGYKDITLGAAPYADDRLTIVARVEDADGMVSGVGTTQITVDTQPPGAATVAHVTDNAGPSQGELADGATTDDTTPTFQFTLPAGMHVNEVLDIYDGGSQVGFAFLSQANIDSGQASWTPTLGNGHHGITVQARDQAGNLGPMSAVFDVTVQPADPDQGQTIRSHAWGDTMQGGSGDDTLIAGAGPDRMTGGAGGDIFQFNVLPSNAGHITDFAVGTDHLDFRNLFEAYHYSGDNPQADGRIILQSDGAGGTQVFFDSDAPNAGAWPTLMTTLDHVSGVSWAQLGPLPPTTISMTGGMSELAEGNSGSTAYTFSVDRSGPSTGTSTVHWSVVGDVNDGNNGADPDDFVSGRFESGDLTFAPGETHKTITIQVAGDTTPEANEEFQIQLSNATGAAIRYPQAQAFIRNDDGAAEPTMSLQAGAVTHAEGNSGATDFVFTVTRGGPIDQGAEVAWHVARVSADASDFVGGAMPSGSLTFAAGEASKTITIQVAGDTTVEGDEQFELDLFNPIHGTLQNSTARGVITNDDASTPPPSGDQTITSDRYGDEMAGGAGNDTLIAGQGPDQMTGNAGGDAFVFRDLPWVAGHVTDFAVGTDRLDLSALFQAAGYSGTDPVADGRMRLEDDGAGGTKVFFDHDAPNAGDWPTWITTLDHVSASGLTWAQLSGGGGTPPGGGDDGGTPQGQVLTSDQYGDTLAGGAGNDTLNAGQGPDQLTGGGGGDLFAWAALPWNAGHVTDFTPGADKLDLRALFSASGYTGTDPIGDHRLEFRDDGHGNTQVYFDRDDPNGGDWPFLITTLDHVAPGQIGTGDWLFR